MEKTAESDLFFPLPEDRIFSSPIYSLFLYYPLSYIKNFKLVRAIWMTFIAIIWLLALRDQKMFSDFKREKKILLFLGIFVLSNVFSVMAFLSGDLIVLSFALILIAFRRLEEGKYEIAGIYCSLATLNPGLALISVLFFSMISLKNKNSSFLVWFLITMGLMCFSGYLLLDKWLIQFLQCNLKVLQQSITLANSQDWLKLAFLLIFMIIEWLRSINQIDLSTKFAWLFYESLIFVTLSFASFFPNLYILFIPSLLLIFIEWKRRGHVMASTIAYINLSIYLILTLLLLIFKPGVLIGLEKLPRALFWLIGIHLIVNMYWIRGWIYRNTLPKSLKIK